MVLTDDWPIFRGIIVYVDRDDTSIDMHEPERYEVLVMRKEDCFEGEEEYVGYLERLVRLL